MLNKSKISENHGTKHSEFGTNDIFSSFLDINKCAMLIRHKCAHLRHLYS